MKKLSLVKMMFMTIMATTAISHNVRADVVYDDGGTHLINYDINKSIWVQNQPIVERVSFSFVSAFWVLREKADVQGCTSVAGGRKPGATRMRGYINQAIT